MLVSADNHDLVLRLIEVDSLALSLRNRDGHTVRRPLKALEEALLELESRVAADMSGGIA
jgi:hypothetical protein